MKNFFSLDCVVNPRSIAIVGISNDQRSLGKAVLNNIERFIYSGDVYLVSKKDKTIGEYKCFPSVEDLPEDIDVAILAIPKAAVLPAVKTLGEKNCKAAVIFASGYAEAGEDGTREQAELKEVAQLYGMLIVGPNCMGLTNFKDGIPITFETINPYRNKEAGPGVAIIAQSGAMANNIREALIGRNLPISCSVSTGNEALLSLEDYIDYFLDDDGTKIIAVYAEQIRKPSTFLKLAARARKVNKPIILHMIGKSKRARDAAQSHTGALTGDFKTAQALLSNESVIVTNTVDELFDVIPLLLNKKVLSEGGLALITGSGAVKNISLDLGEDLGIEFSHFTDKTLASLATTLPSFAVNENPLDYTTAAMKDPSIMQKIIETVSEDDNVGSVIVAQMAGSELNQSDKAEFMVPAVAHSDKPAALVVLGDDGPLTQTLKDAICETKVAFFRSLDRAMRAMALVNKYAKSVNKPEREVLESNLSGKQVTAPLMQTGPALAEYQAKAWLSEAGISVPEGQLARTLDEAKNLAAELGWPLVLKAQSSELLHKSDVGGVALNISSFEELETAWQKMQRKISAAKPNLILDGILVEKMGSPGIELVVGASRDEQWGPVIVVGLGGIWIEVLDDVRILSPSVTKEQVITELKKLRSAKLLMGARGQSAVDLEAIAEVVQTIGAIMIDNPGIKEIDINPLVAYSSGVVALDALVVK